MFSDLLLFIILYYRDKIKNLKKSAVFGSRIKKVDKKMVNAATAPVECNDSLEKESFEAVTEDEDEAEVEEEEEEDDRASFFDEDFGSCGSGDVTPLESSKYKRVTQSSHQDSPPAKKSFLDAMVIFMETISKTITQPDASQGSSGGPCTNGHNYQVLDKEMGILFCSKCGATLRVPK